MPILPSRPKTASLAPPIIFGVLMVLSVLVLSALWNIALLTDWFRNQPAFHSGGAGYWTFLVGGYVLFLTVIIGLILFIVSLARQIRLNQRQQNFIDSVTHELKSPLTSLKLHLETLQLRQLPPEKISQFTSLMLADVERLNLLIDHVLEAGLVEQHRREYQIREMPVLPQVEAAVKLVSTRLGLPEQAISVVGEDVAVKTDPIALEVVLVNLLENAVKYSRELVRVDVRIYQPTEHQVAIAIADTGVGIPRHQFKRIFHRFHRVGNELTRSRKGTGLGLYIVKETLRHMKGTVRVVSQGENQGSVFTVILPGAPHV